MATDGVSGTGPQLACSTATGRDARIWITRPLQDAVSWVGQLRKEGFNAQALPLIEIAPVSDAGHLQAQATAWQQLGSYNACLFVSANAVAHFFKLKHAVTQECKGVAAIKNIAQAAQDAATDQLLPTLRCMAPGPGTVAALRAAGVAASQIDAPPADAAQFDSEALWQVIGKRDWRGCRVLVVRGLSPSVGGQAAVPGRDWIMRQWQDAGARVDAISVYQRCAPAWSESLAQRLHDAGEHPSIWVFSSSEALDNLARLVVHPQYMRSMPGGMNLRRAVALATHSRIAATARAMGWGSVHECRPALTDVARALAAIRAAQTC